MYTNREDLSAANVKYNRLDDGDGSGSNGVVGIATGSSGAQKRNYVAAAAAATNNENYMDDALIEDLSYP